MKVFVVGPVPPYRGGISHSNMMFLDALAKSHDVTAVSFSRLFPKILYPGFFQKSGKREKTGFRVLELLDSLNPFTWEQCVNLVKKEAPSHVVFQWWTTFLAPCYFYIAFRIRRFSRVSVVCQNVLPHEESAVHGFLAKIFFSQAHNFTCLSKSDLGALRQISPKAKAGYIVEPTSEKNFPENRLSKAEAKKRLGFAGKNIMFFGFVRAYKGLEYLLRAMPLVLERFPDVKLHVVGEFWGGRQKYSNLISGLGIADSVLIEDSYVPDETVPVYFRAADAVVLPYVTSTESGIIQLAFGFGLPVITTDAGGNPDLIEHGKTGLVVERKNPQKLARAITDFYEKRLGPAISRAMLSSKKKFLWNREKEKILFGEY